jgi:L-ascorbate metabolism protein UlaG (beta-lactamase superfamily)
MRWFFVMIVLLGVYTCVANKHSPVTDHFNGEVYIYPYKPYKKTFSQFMQYVLNRKGVKWPEWVENTHYDKPPLRVYGKDMRVCLVNHATVLIQTQGLNILTDPMWSERASPVSFIGPKRIHAPGIAFEDLPPIDIVVISHNHYDHLDLPTVSKLELTFHPTFFVGLGVKDNMRSTVPNANVIELDWGQSYADIQNIKIHFCPCQHWSSRGLFDHNKTLWGAFVLETQGGNIYFAGDTGYSPHFKEAQEKFKSFRLALMPIGAYQPRWFMEYAHVDPPQSLQGFKDLNATYGLAIHHGCFPLADEGPEDAQTLLMSLMQNKENKQLKERFQVVSPGKAWWIP